MTFYVYILASQRNGTLYTGSTDDLARRVFEHQEKTFPGFTAKHGVVRLVWYEAHETRESAFVRERRIKKWNRLWKLEMIERTNPGWRDLLDEFTAPRFKPGSPLPRG
jgi:putative endonuclease